MSVEQKPSQSKPSRAPRAFSADDPKLERRQYDEPGDSPYDGEEEGSQGSEVYMPDIADVKRGFRWGAVFVAAGVTLSGLAIGLWFERFVSVTLMRDDWLGWLAFGLVSLMGFALVMILLGEIVGLSRLTRLKKFRAKAQLIIDNDDAKEARRFTSKLVKLFDGRSDMKWALARFREHDGDILGGMDVMKLADRQLMEPLDTQARAAIGKASKRVSLVTALSPAAILDMVYVLVENLRLMRLIAGVYGGRPGIMGALKLGRMVILHIVATGGLALTDDLFGQFLGQDLVRRLSRRAGEGIFNGALTARIGIAAIDVCRPLPFIEAKPPRLRDFAVEIFKRKKAPSEDG